MRMASFFYPLLPLPIAPVKRPRSDCSASDGEGRPVRGLDGQFRLPPVDAPLPPLMDQLASKRNVFMQVSKIGSSFSPPSANAVQVMVNLVPPQGRRLKLHSIFRGPLIPSRGRSYDSPWCRPPFTEENHGSVTSVLAQAYSPSPRPPP